MIQGSCLCGDIAYEIDGDLQGMSYCHCSYCRKSHGTNFGTYASVYRAAVRWTKGEARIQSYQSSPALSRGFCPRCGAAICVTPVDGDKLYFPVGNLDEPLERRPDRHIFVGSKAPWYEITDALPQHDAYSAVGEGPVVEREVRQPATTGAANGSCNCGAVAFEYTGPVQAMWNCHCSRCRKARGSAHATNLFVRRENFSWTQGEDKVRIYKLPGAERFAQAFCIDCGSAVARVNEASPLVVIPVGAMDADPGMQPRGHIFVGSKSGWFEICDDLTQHEQTSSA